MKILAINSSLRGGGQSRTELMMNHLVDGMRQAGADVDVVNLREKNIKYCMGCYTCWTKTPGQCALKDDFTEALFAQWLAADMVVYATPLFHHTVNAPMKTFIERTVPIHEPFLEKRTDGRWMHPSRQQEPLAVLLSVAGFLDVSEFDSLSQYAHYLWGDRLIAEIYRPASMVINQCAYQDIQNDIFDATRQAGCELVETTSILAETMARISQPLSAEDKVQRTSNAFWGSCLAENVIPKTFEQRGGTPRPSNVEDFMTIMPSGFNAQAAGDTQATLQFRFSGSVEGECYFTIQNGTIDAATGLAENPSLTITAPFDVWMDIMTGKVDGTQMLMEQKYTAAGDISLLLKMNELFSRN